MLPIPINVQGLIFLRLIFQFVTYLRINRPRAIVMRARLLATAQNMMACGLQWMRFIGLIIKYLENKRRKKRLIKPHKLITLMRGYR